MPSMTPAPDSTGDSTPESRPSASPDRAAIATSDDPHRHQTSSHGLTLSLRVEVRHDPALRRRLTPGGNQVGVLPHTLTQGDPPEAYTRGEYREREQTRKPDGESGPGRRSIGGEEGEQDQRQTTESRAENRECEKAGR